MSDASDGQEEMSRRERKKLELRRRIRRAAARLFEERGYEATTVDEIAEAADVAKGTFFNYFPRKDALLSEIGLDLLEDVEEELGEPETWRGSRREQLVRFHVAIGDRVHRNPKLFQVMVMENLRRFWIAGEEETEQRARWIVRWLLDEAVSAGELPDGVDVETAMKLIEAVYATTLIESLRLGRSAQAFRAELTRRINIIYRGLGGEPVRVEGVGA